MKKVIVLISIFLIIESIYSFPQKTDEELFKQAKIYLFDEQWTKALEKLNKIIKNHKNSDYYSVAIFYKGKCLEELQKKMEAFETYQKYIKLSRNKSLEQEAKISIIDLAFDFYHDGNEKFLKEIESFLKSRNKLVQYYAAFKLSYFKNKKIAEKGVSVLKKIIENEKSEELIDRAKIALLRINPDYLKDITDKEKNYRSEILKIRIFKKTQKEPIISINIPFSLADLALKALSDKQKDALAEKGYDIDKILKDLSSGLSIKVEENEEIIQIWIEKQKN